MIYKKFQIPCPLPVLDHNVGNLTFNNTLPVHMVILPNNSEINGVNFMMDYTHQNPAGLDENQAKGSLHGSGVEYEAHSDDKCQPKYFVFNSRVSDEPTKTAGSSFYKLRWLGIAICVEKLHMRCCLCFSDGLRNSHPSICFCVPP